MGDSHLHPRHPHQFFRDFPRHWPQLRRICPRAHDELIQGMAWCSHKHTAVLFHDTKLRHQLFQLPPHYILRHHLHLHLHGLLLSHRDFRPLGIQNQQALHPVRPTSYDKNPEHQQCPYDTARRIFYRK